MRSTEMKNNKVYPTNKDLRVFSKDKHRPSFLSTEHDSKNKSDYRIGGSKTQMN